MQSCCVILFQQFPKFIMWQLIVLENKRLKQWGIIKGELCALPLDREDAGPLQPASMKGKEFPIERWGIPGSHPHYLLLEQSSDAKLALDLGASYRINQESNHKKKGYYAITSKKNHCCDGSQPRDWQCNCCAMWASRG